MWFQVLLWVIFNIFVVAMLALDLGVFHRTAHVIHVSEALVVVCAVGHAGIAVQSRHLLCGMVQSQRSSS